MSDLLSPVPVGLPDALLHGENRLNEADGGVFFPFMQLPVEIRSRIIAYAIRQAGPACPPQTAYVIPPIVYTKDVANLLCVSKHFHTLAVPELYAKIIWEDRGQSTSLITALQLHPEYWRHVRDFELILTCNHHVDARSLVETLITDGQNSTKANNSMVIRLLVATRCPQKSIAISVIAALRPTQLEWTCWADLGPRVDPSFDTLWGLSFMDSYRTEIGPPITLAQSGGLDRIARLRLTCFFPDLQSAQLLASLPNLQSLTLSGYTTAFINRRFLQTILTKAHTRSTLTALSLCGMPFEMRRDLHSKLGLCILTAVGDNFDCRTSVCDLRFGPEEKIWHGCLDIAKFDYHEHLLAPHIECPRCCTIAGQPVVMPDDSSLSSQEHAVEQEKSTIPDAQEPSWRFGLCNDHYRQISSKTSAAMIRSVTTMSTSSTRDCSNTCDGTLASCTSFDSKHQKSAPRRTHSS